MASYACDPLRIADSIHGTACCNSSEFLRKGRSGECELRGLPVQGVDFLGAGVAKQER